MNDVGRKNARRIGGRGTEGEGLEPPRAFARLISSQLPYQLD